MGPHLVAVLRAAILASALAIVLVAVGTPKPLVARAQCPAVNTWLGPPDINRYADGNCGYYVNGLSVPFTQNNTTISTLNFSGTIVQEQNVSVGTGGLITTAPGTQWTDSGGVIGAFGGDLEFGAATTVQLAGGAWTISAVGGTLNFNGTATQPITLTSANATPAAGDWGRVEYDAGSTGGMSFTNLSYAGASALEDGCGSCTYAAGILVTGGNPPLSHVTVSNSAGNGIEYTTTTNNVTALTVTDTTGFAAYFDSTNADLSQFAITASGNGENAVGVSGNVNQTNGATGTWNNPGVPIFPQGDVVTNNLNVGAGVTILLNAGHTIFDPGGALNFNGTATQPITLTSANATPAAGDWGRVEYDAGSTGTMSFTTLKFAGAPSLASGEGCCTFSAGILVYGGSPTLTSVTLSNNLGNGVELNSGSLAIAGGAFTNNQSAAVRYDFLADLSKVSKLAASGNGQNALSMQAGSTSSALTWPSIGIPIAITGGDVNISAGKFTIKPGATIQLNNGESLAITGGTLSAVGTSARRITITSANATPKAGDWGSVQITGAANGTLSFATIDFGGAGGSQELLVSGPSPTVENDIFENSAGHDVNVVSGLPTLGYNWLLEVPSGFDGVVNSGTAALNASQNFWGSATGPTSPSNPTGKGTPVGANVTFSPFLGTTASPTSGAPGSSVTVSGTGYNAGETITIRWACTSQGCGTKTTVLATATASPTGTFSASVSIPTNATVNKTFLIGAVGSVSQALAEASFRVT
jgi:hypothetical protein